MISSSISKIISKASLASEPPDESMAPNDLFMRTDIDGRLKFWHSTKISRLARKSSADDHAIGQLVFEARETKHFDEIVACKSTGKPEIMNVVVEFEEREIVGTEGSDPIKVVVRRDASHPRFNEVPLLCEWVLENGTVDKKAFKELSTHSGVFEFKPGEVRAHAHVDMPNDPGWNFESVFFVHLTNWRVPEAAAPEATDMRPAWGRNDRLQVYVCNTESFPHAILSETEVRSDPGLNKLSSARVAWKFILHNKAEIPKETRYAIMLSCVPAILNYVTEITVEATLNCGVKSGSMCTVWGVEIVAGGKLEILVGIAAINLVLLILEYITHRQMRNLRLGGKALKCLRTNMFGTMLQMSDESKGQFDQGELASILNNTSQTAIDDVWLTGFTVLTLILNLLIKVVLAVTISVNTTGLARFLGTLSLPVMLILATTLLASRKKKLNRMMKFVFDTSQDIYAYVTRMESCVDLILRYRKGWSVTFADARCPEDPSLHSASFASLHRRFNEANATAADYFSDTLWLVKAMVNLISAIVLVFAGKAVVETNLEIGSFVVLLRCVDGLGGIIDSLSHAINKMVAGCVAVCQIANVLNCVTRRLDKVQRLRHEARDDPDEVIELRDVEFLYKGRSRHAVPRMNLAIPCGHVICWPHLGNSAELIGRNTVFKLISQEILPTNGSVRKRGCWSSVIVPVVPILLDGTLMANLLFGGCVVSRENDFEAVWQVCEALGMSNEVLRKSEFDVGTNGTAMRFSDRIIVSIVRALMHGVDVLIIDKALDILGKERTVKILRYLRGFVRRRGLPDEIKMAKDTLPTTLSHVKTVLFATKIANMEDEAHMVLREVNERDAHMVVHEVSKSGEESCDGAGIGIRTIAV